MVAACQLTPFSCIFSCVGGWLRWLLKPNLVIIQIAFEYFFLSLNTSNLQHRELLSYLVSTCMALINFLLPSQGNPG